MSVQCVSREFQTAAICPGTHAYTLVRSPSAQCVVRNSQTMALLPDSTQTHWREALWVYGVWTEICTVVDPHPTHAYTLVKGRSKYSESQPWFLQSKCWSWVVFTKLNCFGDIFYSCYCNVAALFNLWLFDCPYSLTHYATYMNRFLMKQFNTGNIAVVEECKFYFSFETLSIQLAAQTVKFVRALRCDGKYFMSVVPTSFELWINVDL